jgi:hypothetical protein
MLLAIMFNASVNSAINIGNLFTKLSLASIVTIIVPLMSLLPGKWIESFVLIFAEGHSSDANVRSWTVALLLILLLAITALGTLLVKT